MADNAAFIGLVTLVVFFYLIQKITTMSLSREEPPLLKPRVPLIGHIIGLLRHEAAYFPILRARANTPAITMPLLNEKDYVIFSPHLTQQAMRHRNLDFLDVAMVFNKCVAGISDRGMAISAERGPNTYVPEAMAAIKTGLMGQNLYRTNDALLAYIASQLNDIGTGDEGLHVPSLWLWMRGMITMATTEALYGQANPFRADPEGLDSLWHFDDAVAEMLTMPAPLARSGARHRDRVVRTLRPYFEKRLHRNDDASKFVALPSDVSIKHNWVGDDLCKSGVMSLWASTTNSIAALFWTLTNVYLRPGLIERLRDEVLPHVTFSEQDGKRKATLNIRQIEKQCPVLVGCQRESVRSNSHMVARRAITADTLLTDEDGTSYLLKKGSNVMWSAKVAHKLPDVWGADTDDFNPERFATEPEDKDTEKKRRAAYMPFGGGAHLCPGRQLALDEILGLVSALVCGFEIEGLCPENVKTGRMMMASGISKPAQDGDGGKVTLKRRDGWEDVQWGFACYP